MASVITPYIDRINQYILNPLILLAFAIAFLMFMVGVVQFIATETADTKRGDAKKRIAWGLFGMFIMISAYGLIRIILATFSLSNTTKGYLPF